MTDKPAKSPSLRSIFGWITVVAIIGQVINYPAALPWLAELPSVEAIAYFAGGILGPPLLVTAIVALFRVARKRPLNT